MSKKRIRNIRSKKYFKNLELKHADNLEFEKAVRELEIQAQQNYIEREAKYDVAVERINKNLSQIGFDEKTKITKEQLKSIVNDDLKRAVKTKNPKTEDDFIYNHINSYHLELYKTLLPENEREEFDKRKYYRSDKQVIEIKRVFAEFGFDGIVSDDEIRYCSEKVDAIWDEIEILKEDSKYKTDKEFYAWVFGSPI